MFTFHRQLDHYQHIGRPNPIIINDLMRYFHPDLMSRTLESTAIAGVPAPATVFRGLPAAEPDRRRLLHRLAQRSDLGLHQQPRREGRGRAAVSPPLHRRHLDPVETGDVNGHIRSFAITYSKCKMRPIKALSSTSMSPTSGPPPLPRPPRRCAGPAAGPPS